MKSCVCFLHSVNIICHIMFSFLVTRFCLKCASIGFKLISKNQKIYSHMYPHFYLIEILIYFLIQWIFKIV